MNKTKSEFRYFSSVQGRVVPRYGTDTFIGVKRTSSGWGWDEERVVAIPAAECSRFGREYQNAVRLRALKVRTREDYDAYLKKVAEQEKERAQAAEAAKKAAEAAEAEETAGQTESTETAALTADSETASPPSEKTSSSRRAKNIDTGKKGAEE